MSANNFGTFLGTVKLTDGSQAAAFNVEAAAKQALSMASGRSLTNAQLADELKLTRDQLLEVLTYLRKSDLLVSDDEPSTMVQLTDFASEALQVFHVR